MPYKDKQEQREYQKNWMAKRREEFFSNKACKVCGSTANLELDHVDRSTKIDHKIWSWSEQRRLAEIEKCQVLCQACHIRKTNEVDFPKIVGKELYQHGSVTMYNRHGCRCAECREASNARRKKNRRLAKERT